MQIKLFLFVVFTGCVAIGSAQEAKQEQPLKKGCSCSFSSIVQVGLVQGSKSASFLIQTVNGIKYKTWFAGVGIGLDLYDRPGIPLFLDVRKYLYAKRATPFVYADAGVLLPTNRYQAVSMFYQNVYSNTFYGDAGLGYKFGAGSAQRWMLSAGYSYKSLFYRNESTATCTNCYESYITYKNYSHRLSLKLGLQF